MEKWVNILSSTQSQKYQTFLNIKIKQIEKLTSQIHTTYIKEQNLWIQWHIVSFPSKKKIGGGNN